MNHLSFIRKILTFIGVSRTPDLPNLFQAANVDKLEIHWEQSEQVQEIVSNRKI